VCRLSRPRSPSPATLPRFFSARAPRVIGLKAPGVQSSRDASNVGKDLNIQYSVGPTIAPGLTQTTVTVMPLNEPGTVFLDRVNQVDFAVSRDFRFGKMMVRPQFDFFNAFNSNAVTQVNTSYGPSLRQPQSILNPRLIRFNVRVSY
jgi:hypothetical protein